jgi:hypothetical protein
MNQLKKGGSHADVFGKRNLAEKLTPGSTSHLRVITTCPIDV